MPELTKIELMIASQALRRLRKVFDIDAKTLAEKTGMARSSLLAIENETLMRCPSPERLAKLANFFGFSPQELLEVGLNCRTTLETFKYLQQMGKIQ